MNIQTISFQVLKKFIFNFPLFNLINQPNLHLDWLQNILYHHNYIDLPNEIEFEEKKINDTQSLHDSKSKFKENKNVKYKTNNENSRNIKLTKNNDFDFYSKNNNHFEEILKSEKYSKIKENEFYKMKDNFEKE